MNPRVLISCKNLGYSIDFASGTSTEEKWDIRKLSLELHSGDRAHFHFNNEEQKEVLWRLFLQNLKPKTGSLMISSQTHIHSDESLWNGTDKKETVLENLNSKLFATRPWFGGKRINLEILLDRLRLSGRIMHLPVKELTAIEASRFWVLMMIVANTKVVLIDKLFLGKDKLSLQFVQEWLINYTGIIILFGEHADFFKSIDNNPTRLQSTTKHLFNYIFSFSADGSAKSLLNDK